MGTGARVWLPSLRQALAVRQPHWGRGSGSRGRAASLRCDGHEALKDEGIGAGPNLLCARFNLHVFSSFQACWSCTCHTTPSQQQARARCLQQHQWRGQWTGVQAGTATHRSKAAPVAHPCPFLVPICGPALHWGLRLQAPLAAYGVERHQRAGPSGVCGCPESFARAAG